MKKGRCKVQIGNNTAEKAQTKNLAASQPGSPVYEMIEAVGGGLRSTGYAMVSDLATNLKSEGFEAAVARIRAHGAERSTVALITVEADGTVHGLPQSVYDALGIENPDA